MRRVGLYGGQFGETGKTSGLEEVAAETGVVFKTVARARASGVSFGTPEKTIGLEGPPKIRIPNNWAPREKAQDADAKPYEPTPIEAKAIEAYRAAKEKRGPRLKMIVTGKTP